MEMSPWKKFLEVFCFVVVFAVPVILYLMEKAGKSLTWIFVVGWLSIGAASIYLVLSIPWIWVQTSTAVTVWRVSLVCSIALLIVGYGAIRIWPSATVSTAEPTEQSQPSTHEESKSELPRVEPAPEHHERSKGSATSIVQIETQAPASPAPVPKTVATRIPPRYHEDSADPFSEFDNAHFAEWGTALADRMSKDFSIYWNETYPRRMNEPENRTWNSIKLYNKFNDCCAERARAYRKEVINRLGVDPDPDTPAGPLLESLRDPGTATAFAPRGIQQVAINIRALAAAIGKKPD